MLAGRRAGESTVPIAQCASHLLPRGGQFRDATIDSVLDAIARGTHVTAGGAAGRPHPKKFSDLAERETELQRMPHEPNPINDALRVLPVAGIRALRLW